MKRTVLRLAIRKIRGHLPQLLGMGILIVIGVTFFVTLYTIYLCYRQKAEALFLTQNYAGVTFYGSFSEEEVEKVRAQEGIDNALGRRVQDYKEGDVTLRIISLTQGINIPYLYEGSLPENAQECALIKKYARAKGIQVGDTVTVDHKTLRVTGIVASPEYIYLVQNERALMAGSDTFGILFVQEDFFAGNYNEIVATASLNTDQADRIGKLIEADRTIIQKDQLNYNLYSEDLDQIRTFSYIFPLVFALLIVMIIYVMLKRTIARERCQIGVYKALGVGGTRILMIYVTQAGLAALFGAVLGCIAAMLLCNTIIGLFSVMFEVPGLSFEFYPGLWAGVILVSLAVCILSALFSIWGVRKPMPAQLLRSRLPSGGKQLLIEKITFLWGRLSFNTRYALKSTLRNKMRFLTVVLGMCGSCALLTFALGFFNSSDYTQKAYFEDFANYDVLLEFEPVPLTVEQPVSEHLDKINKALMTAVEVGDAQYRLIVVEDDFDMQRIDTGVLKDGVIIPEYFAQRWKVGIGDELKVNDTYVKVAGLSEQGFGLAIYASYDYAQRTFTDLPKVYNAIYATDKDRSNLEELSKKYDFQYFTLEDDKESFASVMKSLNSLIWFMLGCAAILGITVLYSVGLMNLASREYEYMFMGVMGYPLRSIMLSHTKETIFQLLLGIPIGFLAGWGILNLVKRAFSGDNFVISAMIYPGSYLIAGIMVVAMAVLMAFVSARHINRLDIVEGLKARDE